MQEIMVFACFLLKKSKPNRPFKKSKRRFVIENTRRKKSWTKKKK
jgi:hypothetical protein